MRYRFIVLSLAVASWSLAQACGGDTATDDGGTDATNNDTGTNPGNDSGNPGNDSGNPGNDSGNPGNDSGNPGNDGGTTGLTYRCGFGPEAGTVTSCAQCQGFPIECALCATNDASVVQGRCGSVNGGCGGGGGFGSCPCTAGDASTCPEGYQVCRQGQQPNTYACHTCGEFGTNSLTCESGGTCSIDAGCK